MQVGAFLFVAAMLVIVVGPLGGLVFGIISRAKKETAPPRGRLEERPA